MAQRIQHRRGTAAAWTTANPVLAAGEPAYETDTGKIKTGDGTTAWTSLSYKDPPGALSRCRVTASAAQTLVNDTTTIINWNTETYDASAMHDNVTNNSRITLNSGGVWLVHGLVTISATASAGRRFAFLNKNGVEIARLQQTPLASNNTYISIAGVIGDAAINDYVTLSATQDSGGSLDTVAAFGFLSATYLGA